jgi:hypothetical protein
MGLLDVFTGGKSDAANDAMRRAEGYFSKIKTPSESDLMLPELQKYVEAGIMTPAEAEAYLQQRNAYEDMNIPQTGTAAQIAALNQLSEIANAGAEGTPMQQAQMENALAEMNTAVGGQRGAIEQAMAARGTPMALIQAALSNQTVGQEAQQAHMNAVNAQAQTYQNALNALAQQGQVGNQLQGQENSQANQVAQAANAMQQFNAQNQQQNSQFNAENRQASNAMNAGNRQQVSNNNVTQGNARTQYNANVPQQVFQNQISKAQGQAGAATNIGNLYNQQGQQNAGIWSGIINAGTSFIPKPGGSPMQALDQTQQGYAHGGVVDENGRPCYDDGGIIPGDANFPGDTPLNDEVDISVSPGEAVIPRSSVSENPEIVESLINGPTDIVDPRDIAALLKAMRSIRLGVA